MSATTKKELTIKKVDMTAAQFIAHVKTEIAKAKDEDEEYAMKRLDLLRTNAEKLSWESTERQSVSIFEEKNLTADADKSEKELPAKDVVQTTSMNFSSNGLQKAIEALEGLIKSFVDGEPAAKTDEEDREKSEKKDPLNPVGFWPSDVNTQKFMKQEKQDVTKSDDAWGSDPWAPQK